MSALFQRIASAGLAAVALAALSIAQPVKADPLMDKIVKSGVLRVGWAAFDPGSFRSSANPEVHGFYADTAREIARILNVKIEFVEADFGTIAAGLPAGRFDIAGMVRTSSRAPHLLFTQPILISGFVVGVRRDSPLKSIAEIDRRDIKLALIQGSNEDPVAQQAFRALQFVKLKSLSEVILEIMSGRSNALVTNSVAFAKLQESNPELRRLPETFGAQTESAFALPHGNHDFLNFMNTTLTLMKVDGSLAKSFKQYGVDELIPPPRY